VLTRLAGADLEALRPNPPAYGLLLLDSTTCKTHRTRLTLDWLAEHRSQMEVYYLPPKAPNSIRTRV
jgi:hypothetical protein